VIFAAHSKRRSVSTLTPSASGESADLDQVVKRRFLRSHLALRASSAVRLVMRRFRAPFDVLSHQDFGLAGTLPFVARPFISWWASRWLVRRRSVVHC